MARFPCTHRFEAGDFVLGPFTFVEGYGYRDGLGLVTNEDFRGEYRDNRTAPEDGYFWTTHDKGDGEYDESEYVNVKVFAPHRASGGYHESELRLSAPVNIRWSWMVLDEGSITEIVKGRLF
jgi:hypothetical protein